jgi:hypothetical protein
MMPFNVVFVPIAVPVGTGNCGWERRRPTPQYPRQERARWPLKTPVPVRDLSEVRRMIADAKRMVGEQRAREALRQLEERWPGST